MNPSMFPIETPRLRIVAYTPSDVDRAHAVLSDPETMRFWPVPFTLESTRAWIAAATLSYDETGMGRGSVVLKATGEVIGDAGIQRFVAGGEARHDLGVIVAATHQGRGYATEIARALLGRAFGVLRLSEVRANAALSDAASRAYIERAGFRLVRTFADEPSRGFAIASYAAHAPPSRVVPRIKMCGMTSPYDAELAVAAGASAVGMIFAKSERRVDLETAKEIVRALPPFVERVAVFVDAPGEEVRRVCDRLGAIAQFSGHESLEFCERHGGERCLRVVRVGPDTGASELSRAAASGPRVLTFFETFVPGAAGGSGRHFDWSLAALAARHGRIGISGGLTPENVAECVRVARPFAIDVRSGVESAGRKSFERMQAFVAAALATRSLAAS